jgi:predicted Rossmann fold flavoprotein
MGVAATTAQVKIEGTKIKTQGPVLITHWGMSGPAILKASSFGARELAGKEYHFNVRINWLEEFNAERIFSLFAEASQASPQKQIAKFNPTALPNRLWHFLLEKNAIPHERRWNEIGKKKLRHLAETITNDRYTVEGKTTFKEEFVTCGGIALNEINLKTMESKQHKGLYFAGEVIDVDAITGGYNFQAAWSGGYVAGKLQ